MDSRTYYYARVSSKEQNLDRQIGGFLLQTRKGNAFPHGIVGIDTTSPQLKQKPGDHKVTGLNGLLTTG